MIRNLETPGTLIPPGAVLVSPRFQRDSRLQAAFHNSPPMRRGERGAPVAKVQQALIDTGIPLPISTRNGAAAPDGIFGRETEAAVRTFQRRHDLRVDGIVGRQTLGTLDRLLAVRPAPPPPSPAPPTSRRWTTVLGGGVRLGNAVMYLIDGPATFAAFADAIRSAVGEGHYIYLLGWWLTDSQQLVPGDPSSTIANLFSAAARRGVQIRALLWKHPVSDNAGAVRRINLLPTGAAILDDLTVSPVGSHHQKVLVVKGGAGLVAFCGGVDINPDRVLAVGGGSSGSGGSSGGGGAPLHDVHARILGPAAHDLLGVFLERWNAHPAHTAVDARKGPPLGATEPVPGPVGPVAPGPPSGPVGGGRCAVKVAVTFNQVGPSGIVRHVRSQWDTTAAAILAAQRFIYMEDQYLVNMFAARILLRVLPRIQHLTILIPHTSLASISDSIQLWARRKRFIDLLRSTADRRKVRVFYLADPSSGIRAPHTYVHAKMYVVDDELAIIGSANCNRRGWTHDSEAIAAIFDDPLPEDRTLPFAQRLRMALWAEHLNAAPGSVTDGVASAALWLSPPPGARVAPYNPNAGADPAWHRAISWDDVVDPCVPTPGHPC